MCCRHHQATHTVILTKPCAKQRHEEDDGPLPLHPAVGPDQPAAPVRVVTMASYTISLYIPDPAVTQAPG